MFAIIRILIDEVRLLFSLTTVAFETLGESPRKCLREAESVELPDFHPVYEPLIDFAELYPCPHRSKISPIDLSNGHHLTANI